MSGKVRPHLHDLEQIQTKSAAIFKEVRDVSHTILNINVCDVRVRMNNSLRDINIFIDLT